MRMLDGIKVVDLTNLLPGPFATNRLAELGAEVVKVERPDGGDPVRHMIPGLYETLNRQKKSVVLDLKNKNDKETLRELLKTSDVLIEGFRPGVMERLGFGKEDVAKLNSELIYCSISGYGQTGPYRDLPGHDLNYLAVAGVLSISGQPSGAPEAVGGIQIADLAASLYATISILSALLNKVRSKAGGVYIDVSLAESALALMAPRIAEFYGRNEPTKLDFMSRGSIRGISNERYALYLDRLCRREVLGNILRNRWNEKNFYSTICLTVGRNGWKMPRSLIGRLRRLLVKERWLSG